MKVICIDASNQDNDGTPNIVENEIYTVIGETISKCSYILKEKRRGDCYFGNKIGEGGYFKERFIPLSQIDETELLKERQQELV